MYWAGQNKHYRSRKRAEVETLSVEFQDTETRFRAAVIAEGENNGGGGGENRRVEDSESAEIRQLSGKVDRFGDTWRLPLAGVHSTARRAELKQLLCTSGVRTSAVPMGGACSQAAASGTGRVPSVDASTGASSARFSDNRARVRRACFRWRRR